MKTPSKAEHRSDRRPSAEKAADKIRHTAEGSQDRVGRESDKQAEAHNELLSPEHSKGRPAPQPEPGRSRGSNAGNDGP